MVGFKSMTISCKLHPKQVGARHHMGTGHNMVVLLCMSLKSGTDCFMPATLFMCLSSFLAYGFVQWKTSRSCPLLGKKTPAVCINF